MERENKGKRYQCQIQRHAVAIVPDKPCHEIEPEKVLACRAKTRDLDGRVRADDAQQHEADREKDGYRKVERIELRRDGGSGLFALPDDPENAEKKQCLVPHRGHHRDGQNVAQHVVDENVKPDGNEQDRRHAAGEEPAERAAIAPAGENRAVDLIEHGAFYPACPFLG